MPKKHPSKKSTGRGAVNNSSPVCDNVFVYRYDNKCTFKITHTMISKIWEDARSVAKNPILIIGIPNDSESNFILRCEIKLENKK